MDKTLLNAISDGQSSLMRRWARVFGKEFPAGRPDNLKKLRECTRDHLSAVVDAVVTGDREPLEVVGSAIANNAFRKNFQLSDVFRAIAAGQKVLMNFLAECEGEKGALLEAFQEVASVFAELEINLVHSYRGLERKGIEKEVREKAHKEEELKNLRRRMADVEHAGGALASMGVELMLLDNKRRVVWANKAAGKRFPEGESLRGWTCGEVREVPEGLCEDCPTSWAIRNGQMERGMVSVSRSTGREFYEVTSFPILGSGGEVVQVLELVQDVTHRIRESEEKRQSEEYYRVLFEHSGSAVCVLEPDKTINRANLRFYQMSGYSRSEIEGKMSFLKLVAESEHSRMARYHEMRRVNPTGIPSNYAFTFINRAGEERRATVAVGLVPGTLQSICSIRDVTEEEQTKEFLEAVLHNSADAIIGLDNEDRIVSWNVGAEQLFGYRNSEIIGRYFSILLPKELVKSDEIKYIADETSRAGFLKNYESVAFTKNGRRIRINLTSTVLKDTLGKIRGTSVILRDVTEQKALEQQVIHAEKLAAIGQLTAGLAHEMGTPLNIVSGRAEYLLSDLTSGDPRRESLNVIIHQTERMVQLIDNLLQFSRPQKVQFTRLEVSEVIQDVIALLDSQLSKSKIKVDLQADVNLQKVEADYHQLQQVFLNLILNAIHAMPDGGQLDLKIEPNGGDDTIRATVSDSGTGISEENLPQIFEPFFTTKDSGQGTGLGLAIVAKIIRDHGGTIDVSSPPGKGSSFTLTLPFTQTMKE